MVANSRKWKDSLLIKRSFILAALCAAGASSQAADRSEQTVLPLWGGTEVQELTLENDLRFLDVSMPLPAVPYFPKLSYHRQAFETKSKIGDWKSGGAHSIKAHLPFGLTFEAGHRLDGFGNRDDEFVGITFTYSHLRDHHKNLHYGRLDTKRHASQSGASNESLFSGRFWSIAGPFAIGAAIGLLIEDDNSSGNASSEKWKLAWSDEFNTNALDLRKWSTTDSYGRDQCFGGGNDEQQCYTGSSQNISLSNGKLLLTARPSSGLGWGRTYTSGRIQSNGKGDFTYGRIEASIKLPSGKGSWPAFWMLPSRDSVNWPRGGEIDIMEAVNLGVGGQDKVHGTVHFGDPLASEGGYTDLSDINGFHIYALEWYPDEIRWFLDGRQYYSVTEDQITKNPGAEVSPFDKNFHLILNLAIGGRWPGPSDGLNFPRQMEVDYVRVYECGSGNPNLCK